jgi:hypothetical protein
MFSITLPKYFVIFFDFDEFVFEFVAAVVVVVVDGATCPDTLLILLQ